MDGSLRTKQEDAGRHIPQRLSQKSGIPPVLCSLICFHLPVLNASVQRFFLSFFPFCVVMYKKFPALAGAGAGNGVYHGDNLENMEEWNYGLLRTILLFANNV